MNSSEINTVISKNLTWAKIGKGKPEFELAYVALPLSCNLKCVGCYTGRKSFYNGDKIFSKDKLVDIFAFLKQHNCKSIIYAGDGELFNWSKAKEYIDFVLSYGFGMCIFTNGTMLTKKMVAYLSLVV